MRRGAVGRERRTDSTISFAERNAFTDDQFVCTLGGVDGRVEFDVLRAESHRIDGGDENTRARQREIDASKKRGFQKL